MEALRSGWCDHSDPDLPEVDLPSDPRVLLALPEVALLVLADQLLLGAPDLSPMERPILFPSRSGPWRGEWSGIAEGIRSGLIQFYQTLRTSLETWMNPQLQDRVIGYFILV